MVVITPMNKLPHARPTKAELGTEKIRLAGYMRGIDENLYWCFLKDNLSSTSVQLIRR